MSDGVDVLLLCAVPIEWQSLRELLSDATEDSVLSDPALRGRIELNGRSLNAALVEVGMGLTTSAMATLGAVNKYRPSLVAFVGIAGGIKDVEIGDVVIADKVYPYENGKVENGHFQSRADTRVISSELEGMARKVRANFTPDDYKLFVGPVSSGEKVIADRQSEEFRRIRAHSGDSLAVEMEGSAVLGAIDRADVDPDYFLVRGISDLVDNKSDTDELGSQESAIEHARDTTRQLIAAWDLIAKVSIPVEQTRADLLAVGLPLPSATEAYILVATPQSPYAEVVLDSALPLSLVVDLDPRSDVGGLLSRTRALIETRRAVHLGEPGNPPPFGANSTAWISAQGLAAPVTNLQRWKRTLRRSWRDLLNVYAAAVGGRRINILVTDGGDADWDDWRFALVDDLLTEFGDRANVGVIGPGRSVDEDFRVALSADGLKGALATFSPPEQNPLARVLPGIDGPVTISAADAGWIAEDATIYWAPEPDVSGAEADTLDFLRGGTITLAALNANADVGRSQRAGIQKQLLGMLGGRRTVRLNLFHAPGAGGSTLARRLSFDLRDRYPVMFLTRFREGETIRRVEAVGRQTRNTVLVVAEAPAIRDDQIAALMDEMHAMSLSAVVLVVSRIYSAPSAQSSSLYLPDRLNEFEAGDFVETYSARNYAARPRLQEIADYEDGRCNAFFFGLVAFEEEFLGLESYVRGRLTGIEGPARQVMLVCSIAHYFGQAAVPEYALAHLMGLPPGRAGGFARTLPAELRGLLWRSPEGEWRTTHPLIAEEILRQLSGGDADLWTTGLSNWGRQFADFCLDGGEDDELQHLIDSVFTERDDDVAQSGASREGFARLIEKIPSNDGASQLLAYLAQRQPDHPHIQAHTARHYAYRMRNFPEAEVYAKRASALDPDSSTLHHILGMVYRSRVYDGFRPEVSLDELASWVADAADEFQFSRSLASSSKDHGFVSEIQMRIRVVQYVTRGATLAQYLAGSPHRVVVECMEKAEDLISTLRYRGDPRRPSGFEQTERAKLNNIYGNYETSLQLLNALLERGTVSSSVARRQLVWTYLARADRNWRALPPKDVDRMVGLLDENLVLDGYSSADALPWWRAVRLKQPALSHERIKEVLAYWRASNPCLDAEYCSFVAYALDVLGGLPSSVADASRHARRSAELAKNQGSRSRSVDWYGHGEGMASLVHHSELGKWDTTLDFWADTSRLQVVEGRVTQVHGPQAGTAEIAGMSAFFVPQRASVTRGRDENRRIRGYLAFTHDGLRLWEPNLVDESGAA